MFLFSLTFNVKFTLNIKSVVLKYVMAWHPYLSKQTGFYALLGKFDHRPLDQLTIYKGENQDSSWYNAFGNVSNKKEKNK